MAEVKYLYCRCITFGQQYRQEFHHLTPEIHPDGWIEIHYNDVGEYWLIKNRFIGNAYSSVSIPSQFENAKVYYPKGCLRILTVEDLKTPISLTEFFDDNKPEPPKLPWIT